MIMTTSRKQRIQALITLLDDPDQDVFNVVEKELLKESTVILPDLEVVWETTPFEICQLRIEGLIHKLRFRECNKKLRLWARQQAPDLLEGFILTSQYHFPDINTDRVYRRIEEIRKRIWVELNNSLTSIEKITVLNHVFFNEYQFLVVPDGQSQLKFYSVSHILESRTGSATAIALIYSIIANRLALPVMFVDYPKSPMLAYVDRRVAAKVHPPGVGSDILFYINPAKKGSIIGRRELEFVLRKMKTEHTEINLEAASPRFFLQRLLEMAGKSYELSGNNDKKADIDQMISILQTRKPEIKS